MHHHESILKLIFIEAWNHLDSCDQKQVFLHIFEKVEKILGFLGVHLMNFVVEHLNSIHNLLAFLSDEFVVKIKTRSVRNCVIGD